MKQKWIVVAESSRARIFAVDSKHQPLIEIDDLVNPASRVMNHDLVSDRPGRNARGASQHVMVPHSDPQKNEAQRFAQSVSERLEAGRVSGDFNDLVIVAPSGSAVSRPSGTRRAAGTCPVIHSCGSRTSTTSIPPRAMSSCASCAEIVRTIYG